MLDSTQIVGLYTVIRREFFRMVRISSQVFIPPIISTILYFLVIGSIIGNRIGPIDGAHYATFIAPGLIIMAVISNAYMQVSSAIFTMRFQKSIEEILVSPLEPVLFMLGFILSGVLRGLIIASIIFAISVFFVDMDWKTAPAMLSIVLLVSTLFAIGGFINGITAKTFDGTAIIPTFLLTPLTYLGGVFYSTSMLTSFWQSLTYFNPIFYMVNALRYVTIGQIEVNFYLSLAIIFLSIIVLLLISLYLLKKGTGLRA